jgi:L-lactate dehydrogenase complex protein LldG
MSSREKILAAVGQNKIKEEMPLPDIAPFKEIAFDDPVAQYETVLGNIGGKAHRVKSYDEIAAILTEKYDRNTQRVISLVPELTGITTTQSLYEVNPNAHQLADVELAVISAYFGVAENGSVWVTEELLGHRAVPFICQHLAAVIKADQIIDTMHRAYMRIANGKYGFGTFIAGPSKTADIEQSLVLGAHGPRSMTVFIME